MELKQCGHLKEGIGIDKDFIKAKKSENGSKFKCLGKFTIFFVRNRSERLSMSEKRDNKKSEQYFQ